MISKFGFRNFSSFNEGAEISFEFDGNTPESVSNGQKIGSVIGIKGANGSGKTNILKSLAFLFSFISRRMKTTTKKESDESVIDLPFETFFFNDSPAEFYIEFHQDRTIYYYELDLYKTGIVKESIYLNDELLIQRVDNQITECPDTYSEIEKIKLKGDQSVISLVRDYSFHNDLKVLSELNILFDDIMFNVGVDGLMTEEVNETMHRRAEFYNNNEDAFDFIKSIIKGSDDGISDIEISSYKDDSGSDVYFPMFVHEHDGLHRKLIFAEESMGTRTLFNCLFKYWLTLKTGGLLIFDEFDIHLHAMILPEIVNLFTDPETNKLNAQLIVTAHNTEIIDSLGRYRTILVNKDGNESYCYRLDKVSMLRNDRAISPFYKKGKIGGVPKNARNIRRNLAYKA